MIEKHSLEAIRLVLDGEQQMERAPHELGYLLEEERSGLPGQDGRSGDHLYWLATRQTWASMTNNSVPA
ncbi:hypothetical protein [Metabacillus sp. RGM 3146]|uniref:hypothetical protein n=1 Tax=Metabacillus sp. RGM 3146 TaxID=3401092 RepID=UPI003B9B0887